MLWTDAIDWYFSHRDVVPRYERDTRKRAAALELFAGRPLDLSDVTSDLVNAFLSALRDEGRYYDKTVKGYRDAILCVWKAAWEAGRTENRPERIKTIRVRRKLPEAWTLAEVRTLAKAAASLPGTVHGLNVPRSLWFEAYVRSLWDTGLRAGDVLSLPWGAVRDGCIVLTQHKTDWPMVCQFSATTHARVEDIRLRTDSNLVLPWPGARCILDRWFRRLVGLSGIRPGGTRYIRRGAATAVETARPGYAGRFLGHQTPGLAAKHYIDPRLTNSQPIRPPEL